MARKISNETKNYFAKQNYDINNLVKSHFDCNELLGLLKNYDVEQISVHTYDDEENSNLCTWQDCNYVGNWASTQGELNKHFEEELKFINDKIREYDIDVDDCLYIYKDKCQIILYFPLRDVLDDYFMVLANIDRIIIPRSVYKSDNALRQMIEEAVGDSYEIKFGEEINRLILDGAIKSCGTMKNQGIVFTVDNLLWTDNIHNIYKPIIACGSGSKYCIIGSLTPDGYSSRDTSMFKFQNRYKTAM